MPIVAANAKAAHSLAIPGTGPFGPTCQNAYYRWCGKRRLKFLHAAEAKYGKMGFGDSGGDGDIVGNVTAVSSAHSTRCSESLRRETP